MVNVGQFRPNSAASWTTLATLRKSCPYGLAHLVFATQALPLRHRTTATTANGKSATTLAGSMGRRASLPHSPLSHDVASAFSVSGSPAAFADARDDTGWRARRRGPCSPPHADCVGACTMDFAMHRGFQSVAFNHHSMPTLRTKGLPVWIWVFLYGPSTPLASSQRHAANRRTPTSGLRFRTPLT